MSAFLDTAIRAAHEAGGLLERNFGGPLNVDAVSDHDIKLALDVESQNLIESILLETFPEHALYGEEGIGGNPGSPFQWIVDPIDGTVNYFYGIPHFCVSIALRHREEIILGVIYDPMRKELWQVEKGTRPTLNGNPISVSDRTSLSDAIVTVGFAKTTSTIEAGLPLLEKLVHRVRKCRMMGSAALDLAYVATGRLDAYIEQGVSLWDIAAGHILIESAGGTMRVTPGKDNPEKFAVIGSSGRLELGI